MADKKLDRRVRKTRALLLQSLIQLMKKKDIKDISVKELTDLADINRGTFYLHYSDIYDMLKKTEDELFEEFNKILDRSLTLQTQTGSSAAMLFDIFTFLEKHRDMAQAMIGPHGDLAFVNRLKELVSIRLQYLLEQNHSSLNCEYYRAFIVSGCIGVIETWLSSQTPDTAGNMAKLCKDMLALQL